MTDLIWFVLFAGFLLGVEDCLLILPVICVCPHVNLCCSLCDF